MVRLRSRRGVSSGFRQGVRRFAAVSLEGVGCPYQKRKYCRLTLV